MVTLEPDVRWALGAYIIERVPGVARATFPVFPRGEQFAVKVAPTLDEAIRFRAAGRVTDADTRLEREWRRSYLMKTAWWVRLGAREFYVEAGTFLAAMDAAIEHAGGVEVGAVMVAARIDARLATGCGRRS